MPTRSDIEIWLVDLEKSAEALARLDGDARRLAADEYDRANAINDVRERRHRLATDTALRIVLERIAGPSVRGLPFARHPGRKPRLEPGGAEFSIAHIDGLALIGVSSKLPLGVDLERIRPVKMSSRRLAEISAIGAGLSDKPLPTLGTERTFLQAWTRLEAFAKARGRGLAQTLADVGVRGRERRAFSLAELEVRARKVAHDARITVHDLRLSPTLLGAVGAPHGVRPMRARAFPTDHAGIVQLLAKPG
jgi:4'-phosphopantetheinyl transferase